MDADLANGSGRSGAFMGGAASTVPTPHFQSMQSTAGPRPYAFHSVLDNVQPTGNGSSSQDRSRLYRGGALPSVNGTSVSTDAKAQWLESPYRTVG